MYIHIQQVKQKKKYMSNHSLKKEMYVALRSPTAGPFFLACNGACVGYASTLQKAPVTIRSIAQFKQLEAGSQIPLLKLRLEARNKTTLKDTATVAAKLVTESKKQTITTHS